MNYDLHNTIIEVDSELMINSVKRISTGIALEKVSNHWILSLVFHRVQSHLRTLRTLSFVHVRRDANRVANKLVYEGVIFIKENKCCLQEFLHAGQLHEDFSTLVHKDRELYNHSKGKQLVEN